MRVLRTSVKRCLDVLVYLLVSSTLKIAGWIGPAAGYRIASLAGTLWYHLFRGRRRVILRNLEIAFGEGLSERERQRIGLSCCRHALLTVTEVAVRDRLITRENWREFFTVDPVLEEALGTPSPRGLAILSAHLGSWEMGQYLLGLRGRPMSPVARILDNPYLNRASVRSRTRFGGEVIPRDGALWGIRRVLRRGGTVGIVADQSAKEPREFMEFFGVPASTHTSYAPILARENCPVLFVVCLREGFTFRFRFVSRRLEIPGDGSVRERGRALVRAYLDALEEVIRQYPEQYVWMHRRWKRLPAGSPAVYAEPGKPLRP